jgi:hypothetical protein
MAAPQKAGFGVGWIFFRKPAVIVVKSCRPAHPPYGLRREGERPAALRAWDGRVLQKIPERGGAHSASRNTGPKLRLVGDPAALRPMSFASFTLAARFFQTRHVSLFLKVAESAPAGEGIFREPVRAPVQGASPITRRTSAAVGKPAAKLNQKNELRD